MTSRNLNRTWRDVVCEQYDADLQADVPFPVRYLISAGEWKRDIIITTPNKIALQEFRVALVTFFRAMRRLEQPDFLWENDLISVRPRIKPPIPEEVKIPLKKDAVDTQESKHADAGEEDNGGQAS